MRLECKNCHAKMKAPERLYGKKVPCPKCKTVIQISVPSADGQRPQSPQPVRGKPKPVSQPNKPAPDTRQASPTSKSKTPSKPLVPTNKNPEKVALATKTSRPFYAGKPFAIAAGIVALAAIGFSVWTFLIPALSGEGSQSQSAKAPNDEPATNDNSDKEASDTKQADTVAENSADQNQNLSIFKNEPAVPYGYEFNLSLKHQNDPPAVWSGRLAIRPMHQDSTLESSYLQKKNKKVVMPSTETGTGLAVANSWVIVGYRLVEGVDKVKVKINGVVHEGNVIHRLKRNQFAVIDVPNVKFPKVKIDAFSELTDGANIMWLATDGTVKIHEGIKINGSADRINKIERQLPDDCIGGVAFHHWDSISGFVTHTKFSARKFDSETRVIAMADLADSWPPDSQSIMFVNQVEKHPMSTEEFAEQFKRHLVQVMVERPRKESDEGQIIGSTFQMETNEAAKQFNLFGDNQVIDSRQSHLRSVTIQPNGKLGPPGKRPPSDIAHLPFYLGVPERLAFFQMGRQDQREWEVEEKFNFNSRQRRTFFTERGGLIDGVQRDKYEIKEETDQSLTIQRDFVVEPLKDEPEYKRLRNPLEFNIKTVGSQTIEFDKELGRLTRSSASGQMFFQDADGNQRDLKFDLNVDSTTDLENMNAVWDSSPKPLPTLSEEKIEEVVSQLNGTMLVQAERALRMLNTHQAVEIPAISEALSQDQNRLVEKKFMAFRSAAMNWILASDVPKLFHIDFKRALGRNLGPLETGLMLLDRDLGTPIQGEDETVKRLLQEGLKARTQRVLAARVLRNNYRNLIPELVHPILSNPKKIESGHWDAICCLEAGGNQESIRILEALKPIINNDRSTVSRSDNIWLRKIDRAIESIRSRIE